MQPVFSLPEMAAAMTRPLLNGEQTQTGHRKLAEQHDSDAPCRHLAALDEDAHCREHEHFISQRIHELAEVRDLIIVARYVAIGNVGETGDDIHRERPAEKGSGRREP